MAEPEAPHDNARSPIGVGESRSPMLWSLALVSALGLVAFMAQWWLPRQPSIGPEVEIYVLRPILWAGLATLASFAWFHLPDRPAFRWILPIAGLLAGLFHVSALIIVGLFTGFGRPSSFTTWIDYPLTVISLGVAIIGAETTRAYLAVVWKALSHRISFLIVTVLIFIASTPFNLFSGVDNAERLFRIGGGRLAPALVLSGALTWIAARGGPSPTIAYSGVLAAFWWFFPILPDLSWTFELLLGSIVPLISIWLVDSIANDALPVAPSPKEHDQTHSRWLGWVIAAIVGLVTIGLFAGVFGVRPFVVTGISMEPSLSAGDLVLIREHTDVTDLAVGDIIKVDARGRSVIHRIVSIGTDDGGTVVITQGDNVGRPDPPVRPANVDGKAVFAIPWIGKPALWIKAP